MKNIKLDERLLAIAKLAEKNKIVADIGTDHGYLLIYLLTNNLIERAIATDVAIGPLNNAIDNFKNYGVSDKVTCLLSDGLKETPADIDTIIISGMGGFLIAKILKNSKYQYNKIIVQANNHVDEVRKICEELNYKIEYEEVVFSKNKYYEIMVLVPGKETLTELQIKYGPYNMIHKSENFIKMYQNKIDKLSNLKNDKVAATIQEYKSIIN